MCSAVPIVSAGHSDYPSDSLTPPIPAFSRTAHFSPSRFGDVYRQSLKFFTLLSVPFAVFFVAWSRPLLTLALGASFLPALPAMQFLGLGLIPFFMSTLFQYLFAALDAQKGFFVSAMIGSALRIVLLVTLIPRYHYVGPAIAFVCAEILTVGIWIVQLHKLGYPSHIVSILWRPIAAGILMAAILYSLLDSSLVWQLGGAALSIVTYGVVLWLLRLFRVRKLTRLEKASALFHPSSHPGRKN